MAEREDVMATAKRTNEKGTRAPRSTDTYGQKGGIKGDAYCGSCGAIYRGKRWGADPEALKAIKKGQGRVLTCVACQRIADKNPAGIITLRGKHLAAHGVEIMNMVKHVTAAVQAKNPLGRIMETAEAKGTITITTTDEKLAQKLGKEIYKAHGGELQFQWSHDQRLVRVSWSR
jgi:NMD protein affecting ribosome stability and mRNA decay